MCQIIFSIKPRVKMNYKQFRLFYGMDNILRHVVFNIILLKFKLKSRLKPTINENCRADF